VHHRREEDSAELAAVELPVGLEDPDRLREEIDATPDDVGRVPAPREQQARRADVVGELRPIVDLPSKAA